MHCYRTGCCPPHVSRQLLEGVSCINLKRDFTEPECEYFRKMCNFTDEERAVFDLRVKDKSVVEIRFALSMSERTIDRRLSNIKRKILKVL